MGRGKKIEAASQEKDVSNILAQPLGKEKAIRDRAGRRLKEKGEREVWLANQRESTSGSGICGCETKR